MNVRRIASASFCLLAAAGLCTVAAPAKADPIDLSLGPANYTFESFDTSGNEIDGDLFYTGGDSNTYVNPNTPYWTATTTFTGAPGDTLAISLLMADDSVVAELNGVSVASAGIYGPANGYFYFLPTDAAVPESFGSNGAQDVTVTDGFVAGTNTLELIVNNNESGVNAGDGPLTGGPSELQFAATLTPVAMPEPASLALLGAGLAGTGLLRRRRRA